MRAGRPFPSVHIMTTEQREPQERLFSVWIFRSICGTQRNVVSRAYEPGDYCVPTTSFQRLAACLWATTADEALARYYEQRDMEDAS